jgi:two-component system response regulator YesN
MPEMDGLALIRAAKKLPNVRPRFLIASGYKDFGYAREALTMGVEDYLVKPIYEEELGQALSSLAEKLRGDSGAEQPGETDLEAVLAGRQDEIQLETQLTAQPFVLLVGAIDDYRLQREADRAAVAEAETRLARFMTRILKVGPGSGASHSAAGYTATLVPTELVRKRHGSLERYLEKLRSYVTVRNEPSASFVATSTLTSLEQAREHWAMLPRILELLSIRGPRAIGKADELLAEGANADPRLVMPDQDLVDRVADGDLAGVRHSIEQSAESAVAGLAEPSILASFLRKVCFELHRMVTELGGNPSTVDPLHRLCKSDLAGVTLRTQFELLGDAAIATSVYLESLSHIRPSARMQQIRRDLIRSFREDVTIRDLADRHGITPAYLGQLFKKEYGESFNDYRNRLRIEEAARLLRTTELRVYEIAQHVGYQSTDYFERRFQAFYDSTPTGYRSAARQEAIPAKPERA